VMRFYFKSFMVSVACICIFLWAGAVNSQTIKAYMSVSPEGDALVTKLIKDKIGLSVNFQHLTSEEVGAKIKAEHPNYNADMIIGCAASVAYDAKKWGWSETYFSSSWNGVHDTFFDQQGYFYNIGNSSFVLVANKDRLVKAGHSMPMSWKDLLDPKWKGEIIIPSPITAGVGHMIRYYFLTLYGEIEGWRFFDELNKNIHHYTRSGNAPTDLIGRGEFILAITSDEQIKNRLEKGFPIIWTIPKEGTGYQGNYAFILKGTKYLSECKKIVDFMGTQEFSDVMGKMGFVSPLPSNNGLYGRSLPKYIKIDMQKTLEDKVKNNEIWKQKFK